MSRLPVSVRERKRNGRVAFYLRWRDWQSGVWTERACHVDTPEEAELAAGLLSVCLSNQCPRVPWLEFRGRYEQAVVCGASPSARAVWTAAADAMQRVLHPNYLDELDGHLLRRYERKLFLRGFRKSTAREYTRVLRSAVRWAMREGLMRFGS